MRVARPPDDETSAKRRRLGLVLAGTIAALAVFVAVLPMIQDAGSGVLDGPTIVPRPLVLALLLGLPAGLAATAAVRGSRPMFVAAGVLCLFQSFIAFSGVTLGFVLPALLLISLGVGGRSAEERRPLRRRAWLAGVLVVSLGIAAWLVPFVMSETVCWIARAGPDGKPVYTIVPNTDTMTVGVSHLGGGCDSGSFTLQGIMVGGVLAIGALAVAGLAAGSPDRPRDPRVALG